MEELSLLLVSILTFCLAFYLVTSHLYSLASGPGRGSRRMSRVLLVTAHPDDEVMFFGPTILSLVEAGCELFLLVMSPGREPGHRRKHELYRSCLELGISQENIILVRHSKLRDDPNSRWREELVSNIVTRHVLSLNIDTLLTFDRAGVSGHRNHVSLYHAAAVISLENVVTADIYSLSTVNMMRKYSSVLDVPMSFLLCPTVFMSSLSQWWRLQRAMRQHWSQYTWYRRLYMLFSRYTLINTLELVSQHRTDQSN